MKPKKIYLDYAAATPLDPRVSAAMAPFWSDEWANPAALYGAARAPRAAIAGAARSIAQILGAKASEIIFTSGATESLNLAIQGVLRAHPGGGVVTTAIEHPAVLATARALTTESHLIVVSPQPTGVVKVDDLVAAITDDCVFVSLTYASSDTGVIQPLAAVGRAVAAIRRDRAERAVKQPLYLHTDATAAADAVDLHVRRLGVDLMTISAAKLYGPKGSGALYAHTGTIMQPLIYGGGQQSGRRAGTENAGLAVGLAMALKLATVGRTAQAQSRARLRQRLEMALLERLPAAHLIGATAQRLPGISLFWFEGINGEDLVLHLDREGIMAGTGAACTAGSGQPSETLLALGLTPQQAQGSLRLSLGRPTTAAEIEWVIAVLPQVVARLHHLRVK